MASRRLWRWLRRLVLYPFLALVLAVAGVVTFYELTLYRPTPAHDGVLALTGASVLVGPELEPVAGATVLVEDGVITQVGTEIAVPPGSEIIDLAGHTVLPGLIDSHIHFGAPEVERRKSQVVGSRAQTAQERDLPQVGVRRRLDPSVDITISLPPRIDDRGTDYLQRAILIGVTP